MAVQSGVYRGVSAAERTADRRRRLTEATLEVWATAGPKVTMTAICASAGLIERYFYESFANLDEALVTVLDSIALEIEERVQAAADEAEAAGSGPAERVRASVLAFVTLLQEDPRKGRVAIIEAGALPALRPRRTALLRHFAHRSAEDAAEVMGLRPPTPSEGEIGGLLFIGGMAELITAWLDGVLDATPDEMVDAATRMYFGLYT
ncbi:TetR/AcrR family transcriptional regulator [Nocardioides conyzicola]|uniref:TetR/AcrR family transcriptional regulator n=1 Tax=Nocardioides conyzicola TaxID=1651781 RepID=A0ABP8WR29_9ACTN